MKIYCAVLSASIDTYNRFEVSMLPFSCKANNYDEAHNKAMLKCFESYPKGNGYYDHNVSVVEIPESWYMIK